VSRCPAATLEDDGVCIPVPKLGEDDLQEPAKVGAVALLPQRPTSLDGFRLPLAPSQPGPLAQLRPSNASLLVHVAEGTPVLLRDLEGQVGAASLLDADAPRRRVRTLHEVQWGSERRRVLMVLEGLTPRLLHPGPLAADTPLGLVDAGRQLSLEVRLIRKDVDPAATPTDPESSVAVDPRNLLQLVRPGPGTAHTAAESE
jgi:hypothetical protein